MRLAGLYAAVVVIACASKHDPAPTSGSAAAGSQGSAIGSATGSAVAPATGSASSAAPTPPPFRVGQAVLGLWPADKQWYPGHIIRITHEDLYKVKYDDGDVSEPLPASSLKPRN